MIPLYRLRNGAEHFYTADPAERDSAIANYGYVYEEIACYVSATADGPQLEIRDQIAVALLSGLWAQLVAGQGLGDLSDERVATTFAMAAKRAYLFADALLKARSA